MEAMRCVKRRLSDIVYRHMVNDAITHAVTGPGGQRGTATDSSAAGSHPNAGTSEKPLPGPANLHATPPPFPTPCPSVEPQARTGARSTGGKCGVLDTGGSHMREDSGRP